jgi:hypothetical protein
VREEPFPTERRPEGDAQNVLGYRDAAADRPARTAGPWSAVIAALGTVCLGLPVMFTWTIFGINAGQHGRVVATLAWLVVPTIAVFGLVLLLATWLERRGRRGVLVGTIIGIGINLLIAGSCFVGNL